MKEEETITKKFKEIRLNFKVAYDKGKVEARAAIIKHFKFETMYSRRTLPQ